MTVEEILDACAEKKLIIHRSQVFFNERDPEEMRRFSKLGCHTVPWYSLEEQERMRRRGEEPLVAWEVHLLGACEPLIVTTLTGERRDETADRLLEEARRRVG